MFELFLTGSILAVSIGTLTTAVVSVVRGGLASRKFHVNPELEAPTPHRMAIGVSAPLAIEAPDRSHIPKAIRDELDQTAGWWDKQFHQALEVTGAEVTHRELGDYIVERSANGTVVVQHKMPDRVSLRECTCMDCARTADDIEWEVEEPW